MPDLDNNNTEIIGTSDLSPCEVPIEQAALFTEEQIAPTMPDDRDIVLALIEEIEWYPTPALPRRLEQCAATIANCYNGSLTDVQKAALERIAGDSEELPDAEWCRQCSRIAWRSPQGYRLCSSCDRCHHDSLCSSCDECENCCNCVHCSRCGETCSDNHCEECDRGTNCCCNCSSCNHCGARGDISVCNDCNRCTDECCNCTDNNCYAISNRVREVSNPIGNDRACGLEVEFNGCDDFSPIESWANDWRAEVHSDGSCGWECVTHPAGGSRLASQLKSLDKAFTRANATSNDDCGVHCHVDARDLGLHDIRKLAYLYGQVEPVLFAIAGDRRASNHYCAPNGNAMLDSAMADNWHFELFRGIYKHSGRPTEATKAKLKSKYYIDKKDEARYASMNLCPWVAGKVNRRIDTTVEFRLHEQCLDGERLANWATLLATLVSFAKTVKWSTLVSLDISPLRMLILAAPESKDYVLSGIRDWRKTKGARSNVRFHGGTWKL